MAQPAAPRKAMRLQAVGLPHQFEGVTDARAEARAIARASRPDGVGRPPSRTGGCAARKEVPPFVLSSAAPWPNRGPKAMDAEPKRILSVDDQAAICRFALRVLQRAGYRRRCAGNGREAMELFYQHRDEIQLAVADLMMPVIRGDLAIPAVMQLRTDLPFVAVSGLLEQEAVAGRPEERIRLLPKALRKRGVAADGEGIPPRTPVGQDAGSPHCTDGLTGQGAVDRR